MAALSDRVGTLEPPGKMARVFKDECMYCFTTDVSPAGLNVCLVCFQGLCDEHVVLHCDKASHVTFVNIQRTLKLQDEPEKTVSKIVIDDRPDEYETKTSAFVLNSSGSREDVSTLPQVQKAVEAVLSHSSASRDSEIHSWEEEIVTCAHVESLEQSVAVSDAEHTCGVCGLERNLWLCLACGVVSCGRKQFGAEELSGNGHALEHYEKTKHAVAVKLGTIEPEGKADIYCYACDEARLDQQLAQHLRTFNINISDQSKTEKSLTELQLERNLQHDFSMTDEEGKALERVSGPGFVGFENLGNSCYMASTLQALFSLPSFVERYYNEGHFLTCTENPADCFECQMEKVATGLLSDRFSNGKSDPGTLLGEDAPQKGIKPSMIKNVVGKGHAEFASMRQQDAGEYFVHLLDIIRTTSKKQHAEDPSRVFRFGFEEKLMCTGCERVRYKKVQDEFLPLNVPVIEKREKTEDRKTVYEDVKLEETLRQLTSPVVIEGYNCKHCGAKTVATKETRFLTFPDVLVVNPSRIKVNNWVPEKVDVPFLFDAEDVRLDEFKAKERPAGEIELEEDDEEEEQFDPETISSLTAMGFSENRAKRAMRATNYGNAETAMQWIFEHMDDADTDDPLPKKKKAKTTAVDDESVSMVISMGFSERQAKNGLLKNDGNVERAIDWIFGHAEEADGEVEEKKEGEEEEVFGSGELPAQYRLKAFISHKGPSVHSGHYVAHVRKETEKGLSWVLYNDEKVVLAEKGSESAHDLVKYGYVYVFERV